MSLEVIEVLEALAPGIAAGVVLLIGQIFVSLLIEKRRQKQFKKRVQDALSTVQQGKLRDIVLKTDKEKDEYSKMISELKKRDALERLKLRKK